MRFVILYLKFVLGCAF